MAGELWGGRPDSGRKGVRGNKEYRKLKTKGKRKQNGRRVRFAWGQDTGGEGT